MSLIPDTLIEAAAERFKVLSEPIRLELLNILQEGGAMSVQEVVERSGQRQANVSKHLLRMARAGLLERRKEGVHVYYEIDDPVLPGLCLLVAGQLRQEGS
jgi:ArsR family transcriptional regulator